MVGIWQSEWWCREGRLWDWFDVGEKYEWDVTVEGGVGSVVVDKYFEVIVVGRFVSIRGDDCVGFGSMAVESCANHDAWDKVVVGKQC